MFEKLKQWLQRNRELYEARSEALHKEKLRTVSEEARIKNKLRLKRKAQQLNTNHSPFSLGSAKKKSKSKKKHTGSIMDLEF